MLNILLLDNHDSFTYNLAAMFNNYKNVNVKVQIPEDTNIEKISEFDKIIFCFKTLPSQEITPLILVPPISIPIK